MITPFALATITARSRNANACFSASDMGAAYFISPIWQRYRHRI
jgi:hypothetical protein